ncbi:DNA-directed RNA polymerase subunit L [Candidatus Woesearchaeota archaeon]|nr:DNA-directed RNA polymerase subunit L [Candidatus Woesearchaeota archaeon]
MEIEVLESEKNRLKFKLKGETHTFCNILNEELWNDKDVKAAGYRIEQSLEDEPIFILETDSKDPKKVLSDAISRLRKQFKEFESKITKLIK